MYVAEARVKSAKASSYLAQLCKHFAHKVSAEYDETSGRVRFQPGTCRMDVADDVLYIRCEAESEAGLRRVMETIETHLVRFAWRESLKVAWTEPASAASNG